VFFIDKDVPSATAANNVFIVANERGRESVTSARGARLDVVKGERMAVLTDGQRMETQASDGSVKISEFKEYGTQIGNGSNLAAAEEMAARSTYTHELLPRTEPIYRAELGWRIGLPLAALNFVILGLAVASVNPRAGGSGSLMLALFAFIV
jgi:lipopolysaccharide export system permease protein